MDSNELIIPDIHVGKLVLDYLKAINRPQSFLAKSLKMAPTNLSKLLKRKSIETDKLFEISLALDHNFFAVFGNDPELVDGDYSISLPELGLSIERMLRKLKMTQMEFASKIGIGRGDVNRILKKTSFDTDKLSEISKVLGYNFFKDFYKPYPYTAEQRVSIILTRLEELAIENDRLKHELEEVKCENIKLKEQLNK